MTAPQADSNTAPTERSLAKRPELKDLELKDLVPKDLERKDLELKDLVPKDWDTPVTNHHYSLGQIAGAVWLMLEGRGSLRGSALVTGFISRLLGGKYEVPSPTSVRGWLLRVGLHQLQRPLEKADDWVWIMDHTVQIGELKCMIIVGFRLGAWQQRENHTLSYEDVELIGLWPVRTSTGEIVDGQLESAIERTGLPQLIISDEGVTGAVTCIVAWHCSKRATARSFGFMTSNTRRPVC